MTQGTARDVPNYAEPTGRAGSTTGPGLGGTNMGNCGTQNGTSPTTTIPAGQKGPYGR